MLYGNQIVPTLIRLGISHKEIGKRLGITQPSVSTKIKKNTWQAQEIDRLCEVLSIKWDIKFYYQDGTEIVIDKTSDQNIDFSDMLEKILRILNVQKQDLGDKMGIKQPNISRKFINKQWKLKDVDKFCNVLHIKYVVNYTYLDGREII